MKTSLNLLTLVAVWLVVLAGPLAYSQPDAVAPAPVTPEPPASVTPDTTFATAPATEATAPAADAAAEETTAVESLESGGSTQPIIEVPAEKDETGIELAQTGSSDNKISVTLDNVPLQDVVRMFTRISGANIVSGTNLNGSVTVNLQDVEWEPALRVILDTTGNALLEKTPGIYTIVSKSELAAEPVTSDTIFLSYATVSNILPLVNSMLISSNGSASGFAGANAIIVQETVSRIKVIRDVVSRVDVPRNQVLIEAKFVELNDEAIKDVGINWQVLEGYTVSVTPQYTYRNDRTKISKKTDNDSDRTLQVLQDRRTRNDQDITRDVEQDALVNFNQDNALATDTTTIPPGSEVIVNTISDGGGSFGVSGNNFESFDAAEGTIELIPRRDRTLTETSLQDNNKVRTLDSLLSNGDEITKTTSEILSAILSAEQFSLTLSALKQNNGVEIVSNPKLVVSSGETASIHVGRNEPNIVAVPQGDTGDRYAYQLDDAMPFIEIGVKLSVTPTLNTESNINVRITPELSRKLADKLVGESGTSFPVTQIRKINTEFNLESGRTVAIGGLTESDDVENVTKIPVLGDIPIIGKYLFRHTHTEKIQDEVIIFVTVTSAKASTLAQISGIPEDGRLIHRHLAQRADEAAKAEQKKAKTSGSKKSSDSAQ